MADYTHDSVAMLLVWPQDGVHGASQFKIPGKEPGHLQFYIMMWVATIMDH